MEKSMIDELRSAVERFRVEFTDEGELRSQLGVQGANVVLSLRDAAQRALRDLGLGDEARST